MDLAKATVGQPFIPVEDFEQGVVFYRGILGVPCTWRRAG